MDDAHSIKDMSSAPFPLAQPVEDLVPGSVRLFEQDGREVGNGELLLSPAPSSDVDDPLNWSKGRKTLSLLNIVLFTASMGFSTGVLFSIYVPFSEATGISIGELNSAVGIMFLLVGFTPLLINPIAAAYGKRIVYLFSLLLAAGICFWSPYIKSVPEWNGRCALFGVAGAPIFSLTEISVADVFFVHERATPMGIYVSVLYLGTLMSPLVGAFIFEGMGNYHAVFNFAGGFILLVFVFALITMEETSFARPLNSSSTAADDSKITATSHVLEVKTPSSFLRRARLISVQPFPFAAAKQAFIQPIKMLRLPIVWYCGIMYGWYQVTFNIMNAITSATLAPPPYLFSTTAIGLTYLAPVIATLPGAVIFGYVSDRWTIYMALRNGGIAEPEHKLWLLLPLFVGMPAGFLMMGLGPYYQAHWIVYVLGMGITTLFGSFGTTASLTLLFDCFHDYRPGGAGKGREEQHSMHNDNSSYMVAVLMPAMSLSFGFGYAITPWTVNLGMRDWGITAAAASVAVNLAIFPLLWWGKKLRRSGAAAYYGIIS